MPKFKVLARVDAFVDYFAEIEAESPERAVDLAYEGGPGIVWEEYGVVEFDARHVVALDGEGAQIESTARGQFLSPAKFLPSS